MRYVVAKLGDEVHGALCEASSELGIHPSALVERFVREGLARLADEEVVGSVEARVHSAAERVRRWQQVRDELVSIAVGHLQRGQDLDLFYSLCDASGWDAEEVLAIARERVVLPLEEVGSLSPAVKEAVAFLSELQPGERYPASAILNAAKARGISEFILRKAKSALGITSRRSSTGWVWEVPKSPV